LHELLLELRRDLVSDRVASLRERAGFLFWSLAWSTVAGYRISTTLARAMQPLAPLLARQWAQGRALPRLGPRYRDR
jgi:hypothetical protein